MDESMFEELTPTELAKVSGGCRKSESNGEVNLEVSSHRRRSRSSRTASSTHVTIEVVFGPELT
jgi:bacteriocin-like protein